MDNLPYDKALEWFNKYFDELGNKLVSFRSLECSGLCPEKFYMCSVFIPDEDEGYTGVELWYFNSESGIVEPQLLLSCYDKDEAERALLNILYDGLKFFLELQASRRRKFRGV